MKVNLTFQECRCCVRNYIPWDHWRNIKWMNGRALPNEAYIPTNVEHVANIITHGVCMMPSALAAFELFHRSEDLTQFMAASVYGAALCLLFSVSTVFHSLCYCHTSRQVRHVLHRCDRAMIYIFIAGSYFPWLTIGAPGCQMLQELRWIIWFLAILGILYQQIFHERYKTLELVFYVIIGLGPSVVIFMSEHKFPAIEDLKLGGMIYIIGVFFFKCDGKIPLAHAIWHVFVAVAAFIHYWAILNHLYPQRVQLGDGFGVILDNSLRSDL